jgi:PII-like signaling protein/predicted transcriptional regulator
LEKTSKTKTVPNLPGQNPGKRLCIYIGESDRWQGKPLDTAILEAVRAQGLAGATVFRGISGFGAHSHIRTSSIEVLSVDLPVVIEVVDIPERIQRALDAVSPMVREGLITLEDVTIVKYTHRYLNPLPADRPVSEVMTRDVVSLTEEMRISDAWQKMIHNELKAMPVVDDTGCVSGLLTDEDMLERGGILHRLSITLQLLDSDIQNELKSLSASKLKVKDVMTTPAITISRDEFLGAAALKMVRSELKRLPVVDSKKHLVGMLSRLDILNQLVELPVNQSYTETVTGAIRTVGEIRQKELPYVNKDDTLGQIVEKFIQTGTHRLIVTDNGGHAIGLIADSDVVSRSQPDQKSGILSAFRKIGKPPYGKETAADIMSPGVVQIPPSTSITSAIQKMLVENRKWLVVVDDSNLPVGLVDREILLQALVLDTGADLK